MCGRFTLTLDYADLVASLLGAAPDEMLQSRYVPRWNIAPMQDHWVITSEGEERVPHPARWGLVNWWDADRREGAKLINARAETLDTTRAYRDAFRTGRCIVPADGFYEWTGTKDTRRAFWFHRPDDQVFAFAGLWVESRLRGEAEPLATFTVVTTTPNTVTGRIHDRMPAILPDDGAIDRWLHADTPVEDLKSALCPVPDDFLVARAVSTRVNSVRAEGRECLEEAEPEIQGPLL
ncbi:MAG: SOS response-associated peptidase [Chloroflexi bacterium]|nr:SOS response-associated peptidase [Chloroflexota bacterium]MQC25331.1 SOS response-associated peptidase [Chloroflexota bacterium]MQC47467.1 SOS response-associated peptidase [Chloroflexota bacterium]